MFALEKFSILFRLKLVCLIFGPSETLFKSLQGKDTTVQEAFLAVNIAKVLYRKQRLDEAFFHFYDEAVDIDQKMSIGGPQLP